MVRRTAHPYDRTERVAAVVHEVVAEALERLVDRDERLELVTVTHVEVSADLRHAAVLVGSASEDALAALEDVRSELQRAIGRQVRLKRVPLLRFGVDEQLAAAEEVEAVLRRVQEERGGGRDLPR